MKFYNPDIAPKDGTQILGDFGYPWLCLAAWSGAEQEWVIASLQGNVTSEGDDCYYENLYECDKNLRKWRTMPENLEAWDYDDY